MRDSRQEAVRIGRQIDTSRDGLEVKDSSDEGGILMRESVH